MENKTVVIKAKISGELTENSGDALFNRPGASGDSFFPITSDMIADEYRIYAISFSVAGGKATKTMWMSKNECPTTASEFIKLDSVDITGDIARLTSTNDYKHIYFGADTDGVDLTCDKYFDDIKVYAGVLDAAKLADVCRAPIFQGVQIAAGKGDVNTQDNSFAVRFVGTVGNKNMAELGFKISAVYTGATEAKDLSQNCTVVYKTITANTEYGIAKYNARNSFNSEYIYTLTVIDIPLGLITADGGYVEFTVTPYSREAGAKVDDLGISYKVTVTYDADAEKVEDKYVKEIVRV